MGGVLHCIDVHGPFGSYNPIYGTVEINIVLQNVLQKIVKPVQFSASGTHAHTLTKNQLDICMWVLMG